MRCVVKRERKGLGLYPTYRMYLQLDDDMCSDVFLLAARKQRGVI